ncbi:morphogenetic protein [Pseudomonas fluorescens]|uniref:Uncharacterized protein n=1 Tax=Pseudomonas fluorescens TaxID=294 RepID=A0A5E7DWM4_PSEFL|nr:morphogenetic protein [Pseudomonas fluorescens]VVO11842.1 hypothetical protein PS691_03469 [Pseudomonas fluorescens]
MDPDDEGWWCGICGNGIRLSRRTATGIKCPYGKPGDRLWVRETFALLGNEDGVCVDWNDNLQKGDEKSAAKIYRASCNQGDYGLWEVPDAADWKPKTDGLLYEGAWCPSIHMPQWASRILLEITDVRIERLRDITTEQAEAEGCFFTDYGRKCFHSGLGWRNVGDCEYPDAHHRQREGWMWGKTTSHEQCLGSARHAFGNLWEKTGGDWDANPWLWVVEFKQVT